MEVASFPFIYIYIYIYKAKLQAFKFFYIAIHKNNKHEDVLLNHVILRIFIYFYIDLIIYIILI